VIPIDSKNKKLYQEFYQKVVDKDPSQIRAYWIKQIYAGDKQPPKKLSKKEIQQALQNNQKIIAYDHTPLAGKIIFTIK
jgi:hypothetical protein